jgi:demethoxyubiquinone hydroxylase (CLK1/Coq7/Cat5 family)
MEVKMTSDQMNTLLRNELSAVETYQQALGKGEDRLGHETEFEQLAAILNDHQRAAARLETLARKLGGTPTHESGAWGAWSKIVMATAKLFGEKSALKALKEGEDSGLKEYQDALQEPTISEDLKSEINAFAANQIAHIRTLDDLMARF